MANQKGKEKRKNRKEKKDTRLTSSLLRPIPEEMFFYARSDTHFLLYIYDMMRNELVEKSDPSSPETDLIRVVLDKSREQALSRFENPTFDEETGTGSRGWYNLVMKQPKPLNGQQFAVFRAVWRWRDESARRNDESVGYVLPTQGIWDIARVLPPDLKALHSLLPRHAWQARAEANELWKVVQEAQAKGVDGPSLQQFLIEGATLKDGKATGKAGITQDLASLNIAKAEVGRLPRSQLFGDMELSSRWESRMGSAKDADEYIPLPWQRLYTLEEVQLAIREANASNNEQARSPEPSPKPELEAPVEDDEFTLKAGMKRKRQGEEEKDTDKNGDASEDDNEQDDSDDEDGVAAVAKSESGADSSSPTQGATDGQDESAEEGKGAKVAQPANDLGAKKKAKQRTKRKLKRVQKDQAKKGAARQVQEEAFDYSTAQSVLHGKRAAAQQGAGAGPHKGKAAFDPYAKTADEGLKGARKAPPIHGGRSATFKK